MIGIDTITFRPRHYRERRTHLKERHHNQTTTSRKPKGQFLSQKLAKRPSKIIKKKSPGHTNVHAKTYNDRYSKNHCRSMVLERSVKYYWGRGVVEGGGLNRFYVATTLAVSSARVYTRHLFSPREGFLTHQFNISRTSKSNECRDETTMRMRQQEITEMLKQKKTNS